MHIVLGHTGSVPSEFTVQAVSMNTLKKDLFCFILILLYFISPPYMMHFVTCDTDILFTK